MHCKKYPPLLFNLIPYFHPPPKPLEQPIEKKLAEVGVVGDALVEFEVRLDHVLQAICDDVVEGEAGVVRGVGSYAGLQGRFVGNFILKLLDEDLVLFRKTGPKPLVELFDNLRQSLELLLQWEMLFRLPGEDRPLVQYGIDLLLERANTPPLDPAHFGVEFTLQGFILWQQFTEVRPTQCLPQCSNNSLLRESLSKLDHYSQILFRKAVIILLTQLSRQCVDNFNDP